MILETLNSHFFWNPPNLNPTSKTPAPFPFEKRAILERVFIFFLKENSFGFFGLINFYPGTPLKA